MSVRARVAWIVLTVLVVVSLVSNLYLINLALDLQSQIRTGSTTAALALDNAVRQMEALETQEFTLVVPIDQVIPIDATIPFDEEFVVPIETTVPIDTTVVVPLQLGVLGTVNLDIPISTEVPLDLSIPVRIQRQVPIETTVPIRLDVPVTLSLRGTAVAQQLEDWRAILVDLRANLP
jgi:hypothetical protein